MPRYDVLIDLVTSESDIDPPGTTRGKTFFLSTLDFGGERKEFKKKEKKKGSMREKELAGSAFETRSRSFSRSGDYEVYLSFQLFLSLVLVSIFDVHSNTTEFLHRVVRSARILLTFHVKFPSRCRIKVCPPVEIAGAMSLQRKEKSFRT